MEEEGDSDSDIRARYSELLKSFRIEGFVDEFQISGKKVVTNDDEAEAIHNTDGDGVGLFIMSHSLYWSFVIVLVFAGISYFAQSRQPGKENKQTNQVKRKRKLKALSRTSISPSPHLPKESQEDDRQNETKKDSVDVSLARSSVAPELVMEKIYSQIPPRALAQDLVIKMPAGHTSLPVVEDAFQADLVKTVQSFKKIIEKSGMGGSEELVSTMSWQAAMTLKQTAAICQATSMAETRGYIFQTQQSFLEREISARQHDELLASIREDKRWPYQHRLARARSECFTALRVASLRSFALILGFKPFIMTTGLLLRCKLHSFSELVAEVRDLFTSCPQSSNVLSGFLRYKLQPSYFLVSYVDAYVNGASCVAANAASVSYVLLYCSAASVVSRVFGLPSFSTTLAVCLSVFSGTLLSAEILALLATVWAASLATAAYIMIRWWTSRRIFTTGKENQSKQRASESLMHFSIMTDAIQLSPLLLAICLSAGNAIFTYA